VLFHKPLREFVSGQMAGWTLALADQHLFPAYGRMIRGLVAPNQAWFPCLVLAGELRAGLGLTLRLLTPISAAVEILLISRIV